MNSQAAKQALAEDIKREVLMDLQRSQTPNISNTFGAKQNYMDRNSFDRNMIESIKRDVLMELDINQQGQKPPSYRTLVEAVKRDILAHIQTDMPMSPGGYGGTFQQDRALIDAVKRDVIAQIEAQQEAQAGMLTPHHGRQNSYYAAPNHAVIQAVKNSVLAELQIPDN